MRLRWFALQLLLVIMSIMIPNSLENITLRKEKFPWTKCPLEHCCLKLLLHPNFQDTNICCLRDTVSIIYSSNFYSEMGNKMVKLLHGACTSRLHTIVWNVILPFQQGSFLFLGVQVTMMFHRVWQIGFLFTAIHGPWNDSKKHGKQKNMATASQQCGPKYHGSFGAF